MDVTVETRDSVAILKIIGKVDLYEGYLLRDRTTQLLRNGTNSLVLLCQDVHYVDSTGLGIIFQASHMAREKGGRVMVVSPSDAFNNVLTSMRVDRYVSVFDTEESALESLG